MNLHQWLQLFTQQIAETGLLQWVAVSLGIAEVLLARSNKVALYPTGIAATGLSIFILYEAGLYAECLLNLYYVVMSVYGWWYWIYRRELKPLKISFCTNKEWMTVLGIVSISFLLQYSLLAYHLLPSWITPSNVPAWDAWVSATAWAGMWLLARRKAENWILLNISNAFAIPLLFYKQLPLFACLTVFLFIVAVQGYFRWRRTIINEKFVSLTKDR